MGVVVPGYAADVLLARKARTNFKDELVQERDVRGEANVRVTSAYFSFADVRPVLMLDGRVEAVRGIFPSGVREVEFLEEYLQPNVSVTYDLTNEELAKMCLYGLFDYGRKGPEVPDIFIDNVFELPVTCNCACLEPDDEKDTAPLLFVQIKDPLSMHTSSEESGYEIQDYFEIDKSKVMEDVIPELEDEQEEEISVLREPEPEIVDESEPEEEAVEDEGPPMSNEDMALASMFADIENMFSQKEGERKVVAKPVTKNKKPASMPTTGVSFDDEDMHELDFGD
ncbi:MAG: hypothetical protein HDQ88_09615 [Clostridia bacterium]|nr:hypothetical protein [Clostridia bacterium]